MYKDFPVVELVRVSTSSQAEDDKAGIPRQREDNARTIERHGLKAVREPIQIVDVSGTATNHCPEIQNVLLPLMKSRKVHGVVVSDMDRIFRPDNFDDYALLQRFKESETLIFTADSVIDLNTRTGFLVGGVRAAIAGDDLSGLKKKMLDGKEQRRLQGKHPNHSIALPYGIGYDREADKYTLTGKIEDVREMFRLYVDEKASQAAIAGKFGITPRGAGLLLRNPLYFGWRIYDQKRGEKYGSVDGRQADRKKVNRKPEEIIVKKVFDVPPVKESLFCKAQVILNKAGRERLERRSKIPDRFYYTGFLRCAIDGEHMHSRGGATRGKADYHVCKRNSYPYSKSFPKRCESRYSNRADLYYTLDSFVSETLGDRRVLSELIRKWENGNTRKKDEESRSKRLAAEIESLNQKRTRYLILYGDGKYTKEELDALVAPVMASIATKQAEMGRISREAEYWDRVEESSKIAEGIVDVFKNFEFLTYGQKRRLLVKAGATFSVRENAVHGLTIPLPNIGSHTPAGSTNRHIGIGSGGTVSRLEYQALPDSITIKINPPYKKAR